MKHALQALLFLQVLKEPGQRTKIYRLSGLGEVKQNSKQIASATLICQLAQTVVYSSLPFS